MTATPTHELVEHFFRHESGRLVAMLARRVGVARLELVEDVVQSALAKALQTWSRQGIPDDPAGWLYQVARHAATDALRRDQRWLRVRERVVKFEETRVEFPDRLDGDSHGEIADDQLRLLFTCCHPDLPAESQIALALKTLCGFSVGEIARGLLSTDGTIQRRLSRAKERLREIGFQPAELSTEQMLDRVEAVRTVLYLLFNEGYHSAQPDHLIRSDVCDEAIRLARLLAGHPVTGGPASCALVALMLFHRARFEARVDAAGAQLLMEDQDRTRWDRRILQDAFDWLTRSAAGSTLSRYHLEAGIVHTHMTAGSFAVTDWTKIVALYDLLLQLEPSPLNRLNRAVAVSYRDGPEAGLDSLRGVIATEIPGGYALWPAVVGELQRRAGHWELAMRSFETALAMAKIPAERQLIEQRQESCRRDLNGPSRGIERV
jgi:RNA polymerase sigma factor (sigma-70 family)